MKHDPIFAVVRPADQGDEYNLKLPEVVSALIQSRDYEHLRKGLRRVFAKRVGSFEAGTGFRYTLVAKELLVLKQRFELGASGSPCLTDLGHQTAHGTEARRD